MPWSVGLGTFWAGSLCLLFVALALGLLIDNIFEHAWLSPDEKHTWWIPIIDLLPARTDAASIDLYPSSDKAEAWLSEQMAKYVKGGTVEVKVTCMTRPINRGCSYATLPHSLHKKCERCVEDLQNQRVEWITKVGKM